MFEDDNGNFINFIRHSSCLVEINFTEADVLGKSKSGCKSEFNISDTYIDFDESPFITSMVLFKTYLKIDLITFNSSSKQLLM